MTHGGSQRTTRHFEDLAVGQVYHTGNVVVTQEEIIAFGERYDPQWFHTDPTAAAQSFFGGLVASGWLTAALTMRLMVGGELTFGDGVVGLGVESLNWPKPVRPGDTLAARVEVIAVRSSTSRPDFGIVKLRTTTTNQRNETVQVMASNVLVPRRAAAAD